MLVALVGEYGSTITGVSSSLGQSFTRLMQANSWDTSGKAEIWYLPLPTAGSQTVTANFGASVGEASICVMLVTNVGSITPGNITFKGAGSASATIGADSTTTSTTDLAASGTIYFRTGLTWTPTGSGQQVRIVAENPTRYTSGRMSTRPALTGTTSLGYTLPSGATEYADLAFTLSPPGGTTPSPAPSPSPSLAPPGYSGSASGIRNTSGSSVSSSALTVSGANTMLVALVGEYGATVSGVSTSLGQSFTRAMQSNSWDSNGKAEIWYLPSPTAGAQNVTASFSSTVGEAAICVMLVTNVTTLTPGHAAFTGSVQATTIGPDSTTTTVNDLAASGTVYFRTGLNWIPTGSGQQLKVVAENPPRFTSARMSTMTAVNGTTSLGYLTSLGTEYADLAFTLSHP
jgi:hypothetical protein